MPSIKGIGPKKAIEFIRKYGTIEEILKNIDQKKYTPPEDWQFEGARNLFLDPEVHKELPPIKWSSPQVFNYFCNKCAKTSKIGRRLCGFFAWRERIQ